MSRSHMTISSASDYKSIDSSASYIIMSDIETEDIASPTTPLEGPALPDYTLGSDIESEPSKINPKESEEDPLEEEPSEEDPMEDMSHYRLRLHLHHPCPTWTRDPHSSSIQSTPLRAIAKEITTPLHKRYKSSFLSLLSSSLPPSPSSPPSDMLPPCQRFRMASPHPDTIGEATGEALLARLHRRVEARRWALVLDSICTWRELSPWIRRLRRSEIESRLQSSVLRSYRTHSGSLGIGYSVTDPRKGCKGSSLA
ncbi:hypothetical protein Tco_0343192 [Tanacetum coccineum]